MRQVFSACIYDIEAKKCCVLNADKFYENCYSFSSILAPIHYLLRQKPYNVLWGGDNVLVDASLWNDSPMEVLMGISACYRSDEFSVSEEENESQREKMKLIEENSKSWEQINAWEEALEYFDWKNTTSLLYNGYLVNHTKKLAIDLATYQEKSKSLMEQCGEMNIDLLPVLTETDGGTEAVLSGGFTIETTEELAGTWKGDLLQIVDTLPEKYQLIDCCFADIWARADYCCREFGTDENGYLLNDSDGKLLEGVKYNTFIGERSTPSYIKVETIDDQVQYRAIPVDEVRQRLSK